MTDKNNKKTNSEIISEAKIANEYLDQIAEELKDEVQIDDSSFEEYRDAFRFMTRIFVLLMSISFAINIASAVILSSKKDSDIYATSRSGHVEKIIRIIKK